MSCSSQQVKRANTLNWLIYAEQTLEGAEDFQDAVMRLSKIPIITGVYYIVAGVKAGEGVVITRDRKGPADIWPLDALNGAYVKQRAIQYYYYWAECCGSGVSSVDIKKQTNMFCLIPGGTEWRQTMTTGFLPQEGIFEGL